MLEVIVSRTNFISSHTSKAVRVVGLSTALANARDLADWLGIKQVTPPVLCLRPDGPRGLRCSPSMFPLCNRWGSLIFALLSVLFPWRCTSTDSRVSTTAPAWPA